MKHLLCSLALVAILSLPAVSASVAADPHHICATPMFQADKEALYEKFGRPHHRPLPPEDRTRVEVGDEKDFWRWNLSVMPPLWIQTPATCRAVGEYCYVWVADDQWNVNMDATDVALVVERFDNSTIGDPTRGIYEIDTETFGPAPDEIDGDPKIHIFYSALGCFGGTCFDGYFSVFNQMTEQEAQQQGGHSNEVEMFYMSCHPINPTAESTLSVLAHEFEHMIHWNMDPDEESWVDEGCAEYAMFLYGHPDPLVEFPSAPDNNLISWDQDFADYIQTYLFMMYLTSHYGGDPTMTALVAEPEDCILGIENTLANQGYSETFEEVFVDWTVANYLDDTSIYDGRYGYPRITLPPFYAWTHTSYPVDWSAEVNHWAADYIRFLNGSSMRLAYNGEDNGSFAVRLLKMDDVAATIVEEGPLDASQDGEFPLPGLGIDYDTVVMVSAGISSEGDIDYSYNTAPLSDIVLPGSSGPETRPLELFQNRPNPFNPDSQFCFRLPNAGLIDLSVYDVEGSVVKQLAGGLFNEGEYFASWDGTDALGRPVESGVYFYRLKVGSEEITRKAMLFR